MMEFFDDIPLNMRNFKYPLLLMMAEHEQLVSNKTSEECFDKAGSFIKEKVVFKDAYHELQKDLQKDKDHARVFHLITNTILKNSPHFVKLFEKLMSQKCDMDIYLRDALLYSRGKRSAESFYLG